MTYIDTAAETDTSLMQHNSIYNRLSVIDEVLRQNTNISILDKTLTADIKSKINLARSLIAHSDDSDNISKPSIELEVKFSQVEATSFICIERFLNENYKELGFTKTTNKYTVYNYTDVQKDILVVYRERHNYDDSIQIDDIGYSNENKPIIKEVKSKYHNVNSEEYPIRVGVAVEQIVSELVYAPNRETNRDIERTSYISNKDKVRIDISRIITYNSHNNTQTSNQNVKNKEQLNLQERSWEIEIESYENELLYHGKIDPIIEVLEKWTKLILALIGESIYILPLSKRKQLSTELHLQYLGKQTDSINGVSTEMFDKPIDLSLRRDFSTSTAKTMSHKGLKAAKDRAKLYHDESKYKISAGHHILLKTKGLRIYMMYAADGLYIFHRGFRFYKVFSYISNKGNSPPIGLVTDGELLHLNESEYLPSAIVIYMNAINSHRLGKYEPTTYYHMFDAIAYPNWFSNTERVKSSLIHRIEKLQLYIGQAKDCRVSFPVLDKTQNLTVKSNVKSKEQSSFVRISQILALYIKYMEKYVDNNFNAYRLAVETLFVKIDEWKQVDRETLLKTGRYPTDGLIFQVTNAPYGQTIGRGEKMLSVTRKWKELDDLTFDFIVKREYVNTVSDANNDPHSSYELAPYITTKKEGKIIFTKFVPSIMQYHNKVITNITKSYPVVSKQYYTVEMEQKYYDIVCEFKLNKTTNSFDFVQARPDKFLTNKMSVAQALYMLNEDPITRETLTGQNLSLMRIYHNTEKDVRLEQLKRVIQEKHVHSRYTPKLFDIGSGNGGDAKKWAGKFSVIAIEPDATRFEELKKRIQMFEADATPYKLDVIKDANQMPEIMASKWPFPGEASKADLISMFNSITFFYNKNNTVDKLVDVITENTSKYNCSEDKITSTAGYFICMGIDGVSLNKLLASRGSDEYIDSEERIHIKKLDNRKISVKFVEKGTHRISSLNNNNDEGQIEYLVDFDDLIMRLQQRGFTLVSDVILNGESFMTNAEREYSALTRVIECRYDGLSKDETSAILASIDAEMKSIANDSTNNNYIKIEANQSSEIANQTKNVTVSFLADTSTKGDLIETTYELGASSLFYAIAHADELQIDNTQFPKNKSLKQKERFIKLFRQQVSDLFPSSTESEYYSELKSELNTTSDRNVLRRLRVWSTKLIDQPNILGKTLHDLIGEHTDTDITINDILQAIHTDINSYDYLPSSISLVYLMKYIDKNIYILSETDEMIYPEFYNNNIYDNNRGSILLRFNTISNQYSLLSRVSNKSNSYIFPKSSSVSIFLYNEATKDI